MTILRRIRLTPFLIKFHPLCESLVCKIFTLNSSICFSVKLLTDGEINQTVEVPMEKKKRNLLVDLLVTLFGISSWAGVTSAYLQLPIIVQTSPEGWTLPSYLVLTVQCANILSFSYVLYQKYSPKKINDSYLIYFTLFIGCIAALCMAFTHQSTAYFMGKQRSIPYLVITFLFAHVGCMSSVLFMPYMGRFREAYLVTYLFGQGFNGFLSSILALIQGVGGAPECIPKETEYGTKLEKYIPSPRFGPQVFFLFVFAIMVLSTIAFTLLDNLKVCKREYAIGTVALGNEYHYDEKEKDKELENEVPQDVKQLSMFNYVYLALVVAVISCFGNGIFPSIQSFSTLPYGSTTYHLSATLAAIANPLACFTAAFIPHSSIHFTHFLAAVGAFVGTYILFIGLKSPHPPLVHSFLGPALIVS